MYCTMYRGSSETTKELRLKLRKTGHIFFNTEKFFLKNIIPF